LEECRSGRQRARSITRQQEKAKQNAEGGREGGERGGAHSPGHSKLRKCCGMPCNKFVVRGRGKGPTAPLPSACAFAPGLRKPQLVVVRDPLEIDMYGVFGMAAFLLQVPSWGAYRARLLCPHMRTEEEEAKTALWPTATSTVCTCLHGVACPSCSFALPPLQPTRALCPGPRDEDARLGVATDL